jgi:hypothetical protein
MVLIYPHDISSLFDDQLVLELLGGGHGFNPRSPHVDEAT